MLPLSLCAENTATCRVQRVSASLDLDITTVLLYMFIFLCGICNPRLCCAYCVRVVWLHSNKSFSGRCDNTYFTFVVLVMHSRALNKSHHLALLISLHDVLFYKINFTMLQLHVCKRFTGVYMCVRVCACVCVRVRACVCMCYTFVRYILLWPMLKKGAKVLLYFWHCEHKILHGYKDKNCCQHTRS